MKSAPLVHAARVDLPAWLVAELPQLPTHLMDVQARVQLVLELARRNFRAGTGGPFGAAVFRESDGALVSVGVNRVVPLSCSSAHAEVVALTLAQHALQSFDLGAPALPVHQLVASWRPCAMCYGAIPWSGVRSLAVAGSGNEMEQLTGFDEGPIHPNWQSELEQRGIRVADDLAHCDAVAVFEEFARSGQPVYNARGGLSTAGNSGKGP